jgi:lipid II:glycine glycyltransferase (peptidoglycan interpeptide bridge formation enzyme)
MNKWTLLTSPTRESWNNIILALKCNVIYQRYEWGVIQNAKNWTPYRFVFQSDNGNIISAVQILSKKKFGINIIWIPGGSSGGIQNLDNSFRLAIKKSIKSHLMYIRCNILFKSNNNDRTTLLNNGWTKPLKKLTSEKSILLDITSDEDTRLVSASKNWRHNLRRAKKRLGTIKRVLTPNIDELIDLYTEMETRKSLPAQFTKKQLIKMFDTLKEDLFYYECREESGEVIAIRAIAVINDMGWDLLAASNQNARKQYSTYALIWKIINDLHSCGTKTFDFGGIDPDKNPGVYNFKKGLGGVEVDYLGEYEWSDNKLLKYVISFAL